MLVYLDTAHFSYLDQADRVRLEAFFRAWSDAGCVLAYSIPHLKELAQLGDPDSRERRLACLERFPEIRFSPEVSVQLIVEEIRHQYDARSRGERADPRVLRNRLFPRSSVEEVREFLPHIAEVVPDLRQMNERYAEFVNGVRKHLPFLNELFEIGRGRPWLSELPPEITKLTKEDIDAARLKVRHPVLAPIKAIYERVKRKRGQRRFLPERIYEAAPSLRWLKLLDEPGIACRRFPEEDAELAVGFYRVAIEELGIERQESAYLVTPWTILVNEMTPYDCPGWSLWMAISRGLRSAPKEAYASDPLDWEHAVHLPYVDLAFVDKRILGHLQNQSRRPEFPLTPDEVSHIRRAPDLEALIREVGACHPRVSESVARPPRELDE